MPSHFSAIGFDIETGDDFARAAAWAVEHGARMFTRGGTYYVLSDPSGAELWVQVDPKGEVIGCNPHFAHPLNARLRVESLVRRRTDSPMDRLAFSWVAGTGESDAHPVLFDVPDALAYVRLSTPAQLDVQLVAFADSLSVGEGGGHRWGELPLADTAFIPVGQFGDESTEPQALAVLTGSVEASEIRTNRQARQDFGLLTVQTLALTLPVVFDPVIAARPDVGASVLVEAWLTGRMPGVAAFEDEPPPRPGFFNRLLGR